jgi:hypothetical protein
LLKGLILLETLLFLFLIGTLLGQSYPAHDLPAVPASTPQMSPATVKEDRKLTLAELQSIQARIMAQWKELEQQHPVRLQFIGIGRDEIEMGIRSYGNVEHILTKQELDAFRQSLDAIAETPFPLKLSVQECCTSKPMLQGKITEVKQRQQQILIVNEERKVGPSGMPEATWVQLSTDGMLMVNGKKIEGGFTQELVGRSVEAWPEGPAILTSYPGQTTALKVAIP